MLFHLRFSQLLLQSQFVCFFHFTSLSCLSTSSTRLTGRSASTRWRSCAPKSSRGRSLWEWGTAPATARAHLPTSSGSSARYTCPSYARRERIMQSGSLSIDLTSVPSSNRMGASTTPTRTCASLPTAHRRAALMPRWRAVTRETKTSSGSLSSTADPEEGRNSREP